MGVVSRISYSNVIPAPVAPLAYAEDALIYSSPYFGTHNNPLLIFRSSNERLGGGVGGVGV